jgi:hypothetical protein
MSATATQGAPSVPPPTHKNKSLQGRSLWRPKLKEVAKQCDSCPFRDGNDKEFGEYLTKLRNSFGFVGPAKPFDILYARRQVTSERRFSGDFACHHTAYHPDMTPRDPSEHRQCPGASKLFRELLAQRSVNAAHVPQSAKPAPTLETIHHK